MDNGLEMENRTKMEISNSFENYKMRISDVEMSIEKIVRQAFSKIDLGIGKSIDFDLLIQKTLLNSSSIVKQVKRQQDTRKFKLGNFFVDLKFDFEVKFSLQRLKTLFNTECLDRKYLNSSF